MLIRGEFSTSWAGRFRGTPPATILNRVRHVGHMLSGICGGNQRKARQWVVRKKLSLACSVRETEDESRCNQQSSLHYRLRREL